MCALVGVPDMTQTWMATGKAAVRGGCAEASADVGRAAVLAGGGEGQGAAAAAPQQKQPKQPKRRAGNAQGTGAAKKARRK